MSNASHTPQNATADTGSQKLVGWTVESPGRGTLSIIITCLVTTALCTWVVIHPRINNHKGLRRAHKFALLLKAIFAPEFIAVEAAQEWTQARWIVNKARKTTQGQLHMIQAFYIGMFGLQYRTTNGTKVIWPNQFIWLLDEGLLTWDRHHEYGLTKEAVKDKSNADAFAKLFAIVQVAWFLVQSITRAVHHLPLAPLESMTLSYIPLFGVTYFYWWIKPKDITTPSVIDLPAMSHEQKAKFESLQIDNDFDDEGTPRQTSYWSIWILIPRVFEKEEEDRRMEKAHQEYERRKIAFENRLQSCKTAECSDAGHHDPTFSMPKKQTILAHWDPELYHSKLWPIVCLFGISFPALHLISWDTTFPSLVETWLWRSAAIASIVSMLVFMQFEKVVVWWQDPLMIIKLLSPALYLLTRIVMLAGALAAFRASDPAIYQTYVVSTYWIHLI